MSQRKSLAILEALERKSSLTEDGKNWFIEAVDPFHDQDFKPTGYPDMMSSNTIVQVIKKQFTVNAPPGVDKWDASIVMMPTTETNSLRHWNAASADCMIRNEGSTSNILEVSPFQVNTCASGSNLWPGVSSTTTLPTVDTTVKGNYQPYTKGMFRVVGAAFEVVNATSEMYAQGQVTVWRQPNTCAKGSYWKSQIALSNSQGIKSPVTLGGPGANGGERQVTTMLCPPSNVDQAMLLAGSRSWAAKEGCYVVCRQNSPINRADALTSSIFGLRTDDLMPEVGYDDPSQAPTSDHYVYTPFTIFTDTGGQSGARAHKIIPFDMSGAIFSGLSSQTSLTINVRWIIERVPTSRESDLVVMAQPSPCYDPIALELMSQAMCRAPPGVMLRENPLGEWFRDAVTAVAEWAPKIGAALGSVGVPMANTVGSLLGTGAGAVKQMLPQPVLIGTNSQNLSRPEPLLVEKPLHRKVMLVKQPTIKYKKPKKKGK